MATLLDALEQRLRSIPWSMRCQLCLTRTADWLICTTRLHCVAVRVAADEQLELTWEAPLHQRQSERLAPAAAESRILEILRIGNSSHR
ncbi:hypothetical protein [Tuwongella immobilis]|uniref:hypothetical protein n=1 Tax=Tuwongella immobilis TaxID=692036 RepID=UPI0013A6ABE5|nr:hypothetical protein [Tuwongella immobilis]